MAGPTTGNAAEGLCSLPDDPRRVGLGVFVAVNLLATTLSAVQLRDPVRQTQHDQRIHQRLADSTRGTPLTLRVAAPVPPAGVRAAAALIPPQQVIAVANEVSRGFPNTIRAQLGTRPVGLNFSFYPPQQNRSQPADTTSTDTPIALFTTVVGKPFFLAPHIVPQVNVSQPLDASRGTPDSLLSTIRPAVPYQHQSPIAAPWSPLDTTRGMSKTLYADSFYIPGNTEEWRHAPSRRDIGPDTSQSSPQALLAGIAQAPFKPSAQVYALRTLWQPLDTSQSVPKPLYQDTLFAPINLTESIPALRRLDIGVDTTQGMPQSLRGAPVAAPFKAAPQTYVTGNRTQPADTSQSTSQALVAGPQVAQFRPPLYQLSKRIDWQPLDTSRGTFAGLIPAAQQPFTPAIQGLIDRITWQPPDTSKGTPAALLGSIKPFSPAPQSYVSGAYQGPDTSQSASQALLAPQPAPFKPAPQSYAQPHRWQGADTSASVPQPLTAQPFYNYVHQQPLRAQDVVDTSRGSDVALLTFVQTPFAPVQSSAPVVNTTQPLDTSRGSPLPITTAPVFKPFNMTDWPAPIEYRATWYHEFEPQTYPEFIPPAVVPPAQTGGGYDDKKKHRWLVQVGKRVFEVDSLEEARALMDRLDAQAPEAAREAVQAQAKKPRARIVSAPAPVVQAARRNDDIGQVTQLLLKRIAEYNATLEAVLRLAQELDDEEAIFLLI